VKEEWTREFPKEEGYYWFYGKRYGVSSLSKDKPPELMLVKVNKIRNGFSYVADGQFMYRTEPTEYYFQKAKLPKLPNNKDWEMV
jgi:hypothetical protein